MNLESGSFRLRAVTAADDEFLYALYASTRAAEMDAWGWSEEQRKVFLQMQFQARARQYAAYPQAQDHLIEVDRQPVGRWLLARPDGEIRLVEIAVLPAWQRQGIGTRLLLALQETAWAEGLPIRLHVAYDNSAKHWYTRHGFEVLENRDTHWLMEWRKTF